MYKSLLLTLSSFLVLNAFTQKSIRLDPISSLESGIPTDLIIYQETPYICSDGGVWRLENNLWMQVNNGLSGEDGVEFAAAKELQIWEDQLLLLKANGSLMELQGNQWKTIYNNQKFFDIEVIDNQLFAYVTPRNKNTVEEDKYQLVAFTPNKVESDLYDIFINTTKIIKRALAKVDDQTLFTTDGENLFLVSNKEVEQLSSFQGVTDLIALDKNHLFIQIGSANWYNKQSGLRKYSNGYWEDFAVHNDGYHEIMKMYKCSEGIGVTFANLYKHMRLVDEYQSYLISINPVDTLLNPGNEGLNNYLIAKSDFSADVAFDLEAWNNGFLYISNGGAKSIVDYKSGINPSLNSTDLKAGYYGGRFINAGERNGSIYSLLEDPQQPEFNRVLQSNSLSTASQFNYNEWEEEDPKFLDFHLTKPVLLDRYGLTFYRIDAYGSLNECEFAPYDDYNPDNETDYFPISKDMVLVHGYDYWYSRKILFQLGNYCLQQKYVAPSDYDRTIAAALDKNSNNILLSGKYKDAEGLHFKLWAINQQQPGSSSFVPVHFQDNSVPDTHRKVVEINEWNNTVIAVVASANSDLSNWEYDYYTYDSETQRLNFLKDADNVPHVFQRFSGKNIGLINGTAWVSEEASLEWEKAEFAGLPEGAYITDISPEFNGSYVVSTRGNGLYRTPGYTTGLINQAAHNADFKIFPNPVQNILNLESKKELEEISVLNLQGQRIMGANPYTTNKAKLDVSSLKAGLYFVVLTSKDGSTLESMFVKH